jgi:hypothetical protein
MKTILFILFVALAVSAQTTGKTVEKTRAFYTEITEKAAAAETDDDKGQYGDLVVNELRITSRNHSWAAVGIYRLTYKFFYRSEETEAGRVNVLYKVFVDKRISNRSYTEEYLYNDKGALIFYFQKAENDDQAPAERRVYFSLGKAIRIVEDGKTRDKLTVKDNAAVKEIAGDSLKIKGIFDSTTKL